MALNASANHGILLFLLRRVICSMKDDGQFPSEFIDALFSLISAIFSTQNGGNMIVAAGMIPLLVRILDIRKPECIKVFCNNYQPNRKKSVAKCLNVLDLHLYGLGHSFDAFIQFGGLGTIVTRIQEEIDFGLAYYSKFLDGKTLVETSQSTAATLASPTSPQKTLHSHPSSNTRSSSIRSSSIATTASSTPPRDFVPFERLTLLKSMLKFALHAMRVSSASDSVRNLIEGLWRWRARAINIFSR